MGTEKKKVQLLPQLEFFWDGLNYRIDGRPASGKLRRELRAIQREVDDEQLKGLADLPDGMLSDDPKTVARSAKDAAKEDPDILDKLLNRTSDMEEEGDIVMLKLCQCAVDIERMSSDHSEVRDLIAGPIVDPDTGELTEFWGSLNWDEVTRFVEQFQKHLRQR